MRLTFHICTVLVTLALTGCERHGAIEVFRVFGPQLGSSPSLFPPSEPAACEECELRDIQLQNGRMVSVIADPDPLVRLPLDVLTHLSVAELRNPSDPSHSIWQVFAVPRADYSPWRESVTALDPSDQVLVVLDGGPVDVHRVIEWTTGVRIGAFEDRESAARFVRDLRIDAVWEAVDQDHYEEIRQDFQSLLLELRSGR